MLNSSGNSAAEIHSENFPSLNLTSSQLVEILRRKSTARISIILWTLSEPAVGKCTIFVSQTGHQRSTYPGQAPRGASQVSLRRRSTCQSVMGIGTGRRSGQESGKDEESGQESRVIITQWAGIPGQGTGASSTVRPYRRRQSEEANFQRATLDEGGGARP